MTLLDLIVAAEDATNDVPKGDGGGGIQNLNWLLPLLLIGAVFYFLIIRPQQKQRREQQTMVDSLRRGDKVVTIGGIHGRIEGLKDKVVVIKVADNVKIEMNKASIAQVVRRSDDEGGGSEGGV
jgi:preprotein translocase subunit YajC